MFVELIDGGDVFSFLSLFVNGYVLGGLFFGSLVSFNESVLMFIVDILMIIVDVCLNWFIV